MRKIMLATGDDVLLEILQEHPEIKAVELVYLLEEIGDRVKEFQPEILIITDFFDPDLKEITSVKKRFPQLRVILINTAEEMDIEYLREIQIFDILPGSFKKSELFQMIDSSPRCGQPSSEKVCLEDYLETPESTKPVLSRIVGSTAFSNPVSLENDPFNRRELRVVKQQVLTFWSAKPGVGKTFLATSLAQGLKRSDLKVVLVDFDLHALALGVNFGLQTPKKTLKGFINGLENDLWRNNLIYDPYWSNFAILTGSELCRPESYEEVTKEQITKVIELLRREFDIVILDLNSDLKMVSTFVSLQMCSQVLFILDQDYPSLFTARKMLGLIRRLNIPREKFKFILNKWEPKFSLNKVLVEDMLDLKISECVPNYGVIALESRFNGKEISSVAPNAVDLTSLDKLVDLIYPRQVKENSLKGMWKGFFGKVGFSYE